MYVYTYDEMGLFDCEGFFIKDTDKTYAIMGITKNGAEVMLTEYSSEEKAKVALNTLFNSLLQEVKAVRAMPRVVIDEEVQARFKY